MVIKQTITCLFFFANNNKACYRLYNDLKKKQDNIDKLSQIFLSNEAEKYTYFPEINKYDLIYKNYYLVNNPPNIGNKSENKYHMKTEISYPNEKIVISKNNDFDKIQNEDKNNHFFTLKDKYNNNILTDENKNLNIINNNNTKNDYYQKIIKKKLDLLDKIIKEEGKINNKTLPKIIHYKNTIPNNYKKINKKKSSNAYTNTNIKDNQKQIYKNNINQNSKTNFTNNNLTSYDPSSLIKNDLNNSNYNSLFLNDENSITNTYYTHSTKNKSFKRNIRSNTNNIILSPKTNINNRYNHYTSKSGQPMKIIEDCSKKKKSNSYKFLPNNECSLILEGKKNKTNFNSNRNNIYNKLDYIKGKNKFTYRSNNRAFNSIGLIDNSLSTNFIDRQSMNDNNHTLSINDNNNNNNQNSIIYNKNKNIVYTFPSEENKNFIDKKESKENDNNNINLNNVNKIYLDKKNKKIIYNRIKIENNFDNITSKTINFNSSNKNPKIKNNENYKEKLDDFNINNDLTDEEKNHKLIITSGEVNENVNNKRKKQDQMLSVSEKSEPISIQSMSDSKILEIANYYLNDEETVDKIEIDDILTTKNNKSNFNLK